SDRIHAHGHGWPTVAVGKRAHQQSPIKPRDQLSCPWGEACERDLCHSTLLTPERSAASTIDG
nr:hypothetical protein [Tanacetum cinerariifolium]